MMDEQELLAERLGRSLATMDIPPSRVDVSTVVRTGRTRTRRRHAMAGAGAVALLLVAAPTGIVGWRTYLGGHGSTVDSAGPAASPSAAGPSGPAASPSTAAGLPAGSLGPCAVRALTLPAGVVPYDVRGVDPSGRYIIGDTFDVHHDSSPVSILWDNGVPTVIPVGGTNSFSYAVNVHGVVVGTGEHKVDGSDAFPWIYREGKVKVLPKPPGYPNFVEPDAINASGDVSGTATDPTFNDIVAVLWPADAGTVRVLPTPKLPGTSVRVQAAGVADDGSVVGTVGDDNHAVPYRWDASGHGDVLEMPAGATDGWVAGARGLWAYGGVKLAGAVYDHTGVPPLTPARWDLRTGRIDLVAPDMLGQALTGNAAGDVVVYGRESSLIHAGQAVTLDRLTDQSTPHPVAIDESGRLVVGNDYVNPTDPGGGRTPVVWHC
jgi:hypothetical protein